MSLLNVIGVVSGSQSLLMNLMELSLLFQLYKLLRNTGTEKAISWILHNVPESDLTEIFARISHDTKIVADIADKIGIGSVDASTTMRLGEKI